MDWYFVRLKEALVKCKSTIDPADIEKDWRILVPGCLVRLSSFLERLEPGPLED